MKIERSGPYKTKCKKLHLNEKKDLSNAIKIVKNNPYLGELKKGNLKGVRVYKFSMVNILNLLAYRYKENKKKKVLKFIMFGSHENFYRDL